MIVAPPTTRCWGGPRSTGIKLFHPPISVCEGLLEGERRSICATSFPFSKTRPIFSKPFFCTSWLRMEKLAPLNLEASLYQYKRPDPTLSCSHLLTPSTIEATRGEHQQQATSKRGVVEEGPPTRCQTLPRGLSTITMNVL